MSGKGGQLFLFLVRFDPDDEEESDGVDIQVQKDVRDHNWLSFSLIRCEMLPTFASIPGNDSWSSISGSSVQHS
jgi:hypothetical protein